MCLVFNPLDLSDIYKKYSILQIENDCVDTDIGKWDRYGLGCKDYGDKGQCGPGDDDDFYSFEMCCICGGGTDSKIS